LQRLDQIHELDMHHQRAVHKIEIVSKDEESRRLKLQLLLIKDEKTLLDDQLAQKDCRIRSLSEQCDKLRTELAGSEQDGRSQLRAQTREIAALKVRV
jgi:predicted RNase H-like nuclease (RuvC/YqgF family)